MTDFIAASRIDITPNAPGAIMFGWGDHQHRVNGVATPLYVRAVAVSKKPLEGSTRARRLIMLCLDICVITEALRHAIVERLQESHQVADDEIIISATHTHSAPGGFSTYIVYALTSDGFDRNVFETYVEGAVRAAKEALSNLKPGKVRFASGVFAPEKQVAFNRSIRAWNRNPDVIKYDRTQRHLALDREMILLRFDAEDGTPIACWNWFPVHATSMHRDHLKIHGDNKGVAAAEMEKTLRDQGADSFVAVFAQGAAGDITPNYNWFSGIREKRGSDRDDETSCKKNAALQLEQAMELFESAKNAPPIQGLMEGIFEFHDFSSIHIDADLVNGLEGCRTGPAQVGLPQLYGTSEGRGATYPVLLLIHLSIRVSQLFNYIGDRIHGKATRFPWTDDEIQGNKITVIDSGKAEIFQTGRIEDLVFPDWLHPTIATLKRWARKGVLRERTLSPHILPIQLARMGNLMIAAVPAEFTVVSGRRLRALLENCFKPHGVERVIIQGYANAFSSYVTTPEEYDQQGYEGGCTIYGRFTLPGYLMVFRKMSEKLISKQKPSDLRPKQPSKEYWKALEGR